MAQGYDQFFKAARNAKGSGKKSPSFETKKKFPVQPASVIKKQRKKAKVPWTSVVFLILLFSSGVWYSLHPEQVESLLSKIEVRALGTLQAKEEAESSESKSEKKGNVAAGERKKEMPDSSTPSEWKDENLSYFAKLNDRKKELDLREKQLNELEEELHRQREEIEARIQKLEEIRGQIGVVLNERVQADDQKVDKLVDIMSNMKPQQAAKILAEVDENLAVEAISRMKKKNAAEILNLLSEKKAQNLSEKFAGYKKK